MTNFDTPVNDMARLRSALVANSPIGIVTLRDMVPAPCFGSPLDRRTPPTDYYRGIYLEYWFGALCVSTLAWAALLTRL